MMDLDAEPIVQRVLQPCDALQRRAVHLLNHVEGEIEDEDGDSANGFILADPIPLSFFSSLYGDQQQEQQQHGRRKHKLEISDDDHCSDHCDDHWSDDECSSNNDGWFSCNLCKRQFSLEDLALPVLSCSCLFCKGCFGSYVRSVIKDVLGGSAAQGCVSSIRVTEHSTAAKCFRMDNFVDLTDEEGGDGGAASSSSSDSIPCPSPLCDGRFPLTDAQSIAPDCFMKWEAAVSEALVQNSGSFVKCPGCHVVIEKVASVLPPGLALSGVPEVDRTVPFTEVDDEGRSLSRRAMLDKAVNRFRCVLCSRDFCAACLQYPYHLGKTCEEVEEEKRAIRCVYCDEVFRHRINSPHPEVIGSVKDLRNELEMLGVDSAWCVEKKDLVAVKMLCDRVCENKECRRRLKDACTRSLHCGHHCCGVRGERHCLPCLEESCQQSHLPVRKSLPSSDEYCAICLVEPLRSAPSVLMQCGHIVHLHCGKRQIEEGYPGPEISFGFLKCPQCKALMQHSSLDPYLRKHLAMMDQIKGKAIKRMKQDKEYAELRADGSSEEKVAAYAMEQYQYYVCSKCNAPYFGGRRNCGANLDGESRRYDPDDLVCGGCSAVGSEGKCRHGHGKQYIEFKCRFCCSTATFFCFGTTHFCDRCHGLWPHHLPSNLPQCKSPRQCPLGVAHAPSGQEHCLGCSMCRSHEQL